MFISSRFSSSAATATTTFSAVATLPPTAPALSQSDLCFAAASVAPVGHSRLPAFPLLRDGASPSPGQAGLLTGCSGSGPSWKAGGIGRVSVGKWPRAARRHRHAWCAASDRTEAAASSLIGRETSARQRLRDHPASRHVVLSGARGRHGARQ